MTRTGARSTLFSAVRMAHRFPWRFGLGALAAIALGAGADALGWTGPALVFTLAGSVTGIGATGWWWLKHVACPQSSKAQLRRRAYLSDRAGGVATRLDVIERAGAAKLRRDAHVLRPSLRSVSWWKRHRLPTTQVGVEVARVGWGWWGQRVYSPCEDHTLRVAGPRCGKTTALICHGLDAPGALITTSTKPDLAEGVHAARSARGRVHVFNPTGVARIESTIRWRVLAGCEDFDTACRRADHLIPFCTAIPGSQADHWDGKARNLLGLLLHAAAVSGRNMSAVRRWCTGTQEQFGEVRDALLAVRFGGADRLDEWQIYCDTNDRTKTSIASTMSDAVAWVSSNIARAIGDADPDDPALLDVQQLIERGETLHLLGHETNSRTTPLVAALVAEIGYTARALADERPGLRMDPPVTMLLDEVAIVCPIPIPTWTAEFGSRGITLHLCVQSLSQLRERWGEDGAKTISDNIGSLMIYGGSTDADSLTRISTLVGQHTADLIGDDGTESTRRVPVMGPAEIRALGPWEVLLLRRHLPPFVGRTPNVLDRRSWAPVNLSRRVDVVTTTAQDRIATSELEAMFTAGADPRPVDEERS